MNLAERYCTECGERISLAEDAIGKGRCIMCNMKKL